MEGSSGKKIPVLIRAMQEPDLQYVFEIDGLGREKDSLGPCILFEQFFKNESIGKIVAVCQERKNEDRIVGFALFFYQGESIIIYKLTVRQFYRRNRIGTELIKYIVSMLYGTRKSLRCVVRETNEQAQMFLRKAFHCINERNWMIPPRVLKDHYEDCKGNGVKTHEDGFLFTYQKIEMKPKYKIVGRS